MNAPTWQGKRVLITGGYGFVASHIAEGLLAAGAECVTLAVERPAESYLALAGLEERLTVACGSIVEAATVERVLSDHAVQVVFHLAAQAIVGAASRSPLPTFESNVRGTYVLLEECRRAWREGRGDLQAVVVASSDKAYGEQRELPYTERHSLNGLNPYDASKVCTDVLARCYARSFGLPTAVTRCANIYGPGDLNFSRMVPSVMRDLFERRRPVIRSDGSPVRDYLYIADAVAGYVRLAEAVLRGELVGEAMNFGTGEPVSVLQISREIVEASGRTDLEPDVQGQAAGEISRQYIDASHATAALGWRACTSRRDGLRTSWAWYSDYLSAG
ncbi:MAG: NAD-dependent epimerase/dehydratase family protein [Armatimonadetes bacterium]|nr:NAD-dependent epimerase/dehydratase family protein [Armatimonadota bacterium]